MNRHVDGLVWMETIKKMIVMLVLVVVRYNVNMFIFIVILRGMMGGLIGVVMIRGLI